MNRCKLFITNILAVPIIVVLFALLLFFVAGDFHWINGWMFLITLFIYLIFMGIYFFFNAPETLERRGKRSTEKGDTIFLALFGVTFLALLLVPAVDHRYALTHLPFFVVWLGMAFLILSYVILFLVMLQNSYASKGLTIHENQQLITTGLYSVVRHPLYAAGILMSLSIPLVLGSLVGLVPAAGIPFLYAMRIRKEERMLLKSLEGYHQYTQQVRFKLFPKIW